jgi:hypothetical protein
MMVPWRRGLESKKGVKPDGTSSPALPVAKRQKTAGTSRIEASRRRLGLDTGKAKVTTREEQGKTTQEGNRTTSRRTSWKAARRDRQQKYNGNGESGQSEEKTGLYFFFSGKKRDRNTQGIKGEVIENDR